MSAHQLTAELRNTICSFIRAGGFPHIAAEAAGLPRPIFERWLKRGRRARAPRDYRLFYEAVLQAQAQSRLSAETRAFQNEPLTWLKSGPGRDNPACPGWATPTRPFVPPTAESVNLLAQPETQALLLNLLRLLEPYPEVRATVAQALLEHKREKRDAQSSQNREPTFFPLTTETPLGDQSGQRGESTDGTGTDGTLSGVSP